MERYSELCKLSHHRLVQLVMRLEDDLLQATQEKAEIARMDDMLAPKLAIEIKAELEEKRSA